MPRLPAATPTCCASTPPPASPAPTALTVIRTVSRSAVSVEAMVLRRRGADVRVVAPSAECASAMGTNFMDPEPRDRVIAAAYRQGLRLARDRRAP